MATHKLRTQIAILCTTSSSSSSCSSRRRKKMMPIICLSGKVKREKKRQADNNFVMLSKGECPSNNSSEAPPPQIVSMSRTDRSRSSGYTQGHFFHRPTSSSGDDSKQKSSSRTPFSEQELEESRPLLSVNSPFFDQYSSPQGQTADGGDVLRNLNTFRKSRDEAVQRDILSHLMPHPIPQTVSDERRVGQKQRLRILPNLFNDNLLSPTESTPMENAHRTPTTSSMSLELTHRSSPSPSHKSHSRITVHRLLSRHSALTNSEMLSSWQIYIILVFPAVLLCCLYWATTQNYDQIVLSTRHCFDSSSRPIMKYSGCVYISEDLQSISALLRYSPSMNYLLEDQWAEIAGNTSTRIQSRDVTLAPFVDSSIEIRWQDNWNSMALSVDMFILREMDKIPISFISLPVEHVENEHVMRMQLPVIYSQQMHFMAQDEVFLNVTATRSDDTSNGQPLKTVLDSPNQTTVDSGAVVDKVRMEWRLRWISAQSYTFTAVLYFAFSCAALIAFVVYCMRVFAKSRELNEAFMSSVPAAYAKIFSAKHFILPEQYAVLCALYLLVFAFNPFQCVLNVVRFLFPNFCVCSGPVSMVKLICDLASSCSFFGILCCLVWLVDGLRLHSNEYEVTKVMHTARDIESDNSHFDMSNRSTRSLEQQHHQVLAVVESIHKQFILPHHPCSSSFVEFIFFKIALLAVSCVISSIYLSALEDPTRSSEDVTRKFLSLIVGRLSLVLLAVIWSVWVLMAMKQSVEFLRSIRYMNTRMRQIVGRLLSFQTVFSTIALSACLLLRQWLKSDSVVDVARFWSLWGTLTVLEAWCTYGFATVAELNLLTMYIAAMILVLFFIMSPRLDDIATQTFENRTKSTSIARVMSVSSRPESLFIASEAEYCEREREALSANVHLPFCLELSCFLLECSFQTYFNADLRIIQQEVSLKPVPNLSTYQSTSSTVPSSMGPTLDVARLGIKLRDVFFNDHWSTFGYLGERRQLIQSDIADSTHSKEIVVAFRGSTLANIATDLKFAQIPLPMLSFEDRHCKFAKFLSGQPQANDALLNASEEPPVSFVESTQETCSNTVRWCSSDVPLLNQSFARVHSGFWDAYSSLRDQYLQSVTSVLYNHYEHLLQSHLLHSSNNSLHSTVSEDGRKWSQCHFLLTGHSLGAAMAVLAAFELELYMPTLLREIFVKLSARHHLDWHSVHDAIDIGDNHVRAGRLHFLRPAVTVYAFGCPRIGNAAFASLFDKMIKTCYRVNVNGDLVTMVPKLFGFYRHVGTAAMIDEEAKGDCILDPSVLELSLLRKSMGNIANHRLDMYRICLEACFESDQLREYIQREQSFFT